ncbi:hypothetical protein JHK82_034206 [Glycine max]|nr:hypothetical protein JHK82_034206 [Glycine max]KAG5140778.1 hypothetical protein JHK84_034546 [Glycine max]
MEKETEMKQSKFKRICVFCGSSPGNKTSYKDAAIELGRELILFGIEKVSRNIDLVYGGGSIGLMGLISQAVYEGGRHVTGVIPKTLMPRELTGETVGEVKAVANMHQRKAEMAKRSDAFIALPGGYGTLEELLEVITWAQLGIHDKPVGLLNVDGYYNTFLSFIDKAVEEGFISPTARHIIVSAPTPKELVKEMEIIDRALLIRSKSKKKASFNPSVCTIYSVVMIRFESAFDSVNSKIEMLTNRSLKRSNDSTRIIITAIMGIAFGFFIGISISSVHLTKPVGNSFDVPVAESEIDRFSAEVNRSPAVIDESSGTKNLETLGSIRLPKIFVASNPRGAESLPPGIVVSESDFYLRRLWGEPSEDLKKKPKYLVTFTVGYEQRHNINATVKKFSDDFAILLFHYDGRTSEWDQFEWSRNAIHVSARKQTKWYIHLVKKYGLEISQPGLEPNNGLTWEMTKRRGDKEVHIFVEIMAPVFSREAWRCVWHMIQNDLVHGWGLDFALRRCVEPAHEKIGVIDSQWIVHQVIPSLGNQGESDKGKMPWDSVRARCKSEWAQFQLRVTNADKSYLEGHKRNGKD